MAKKGYNPDQPRVPAGSSQGGEWTATQLSLFEYGLREGADLPHKPDKRERKELKTEMGIRREWERGFKLNEDPDRPQGISETHKIKFKNGQSAITKEIGSSKDTVNQLKKDGVWDEIGAQTKKDIESIANGGHAEIAAYQLDKELGLDVVPETYMDENKGVMVQLFVEGKTPQQVYNDFAEDNSAYTIADETDLGKVRLIDLVTGNVDRHANNWMITSQGRIVAIDHNLSFDKQQEEFTTMGEFFDDICKDFDNTAIEFVPDNIWQRMPTRETLDFIFPVYKLDKKYKKLLEDMVENNMNWSNALDFLDDESQEFYYDRINYLLENWDDYFYDF